MTGFANVDQRPREAGDESSPTRAENASLAGQFDFVSGVIDGMRCGVLAIDRGGRVVMLNGHALQILGLDERPEAGTPVRAALRDHPELAQALVDSFSMTSLPNRAELNLKPATAEHKRIGFTLSFVRGADGHPAGVTAFFKDLTQIEHREDQERLRDRLAALGQMSASMAHEIRNPLASIRVSCSLLRRRTGQQPECAELLDKITDDVKRLDRIVGSSLEFVRPVRATLETSHLVAVLNRAIEVALERRGRDGVRLVRQLDSAIAPFRMDAELLRQVFENLLLNALEAVGERGMVTIEALTLPAPRESSIPYRPEGGEISEPWLTAAQFAVVRIYDTGPGIAVEDRDRIYYPFFTTKRKGSGVGLAVVRKIVESHHGQIDVGSAPEGGALFTVRLPMVQDPVED